MQSKFKEVFFGFLFLIFFEMTLYGVSYSAKEVPFTLEDRDRLIRVEAKLTEFDKRFEQIDKRFEQIDKRFEQIDKRFEELRNFLWILSGIFTALVVAVIGLALWDRRTMLREARREALEALEKDGTLKRVLEALREFAKEDQRFAEILRKFNLL
ncbi:hypothetical protein THC_0501 [Caldimicrobium thiodismutans]|uniref:Uncharacterized protein n=1 Tax=Caldimicrobium thiodismutans TaxID=1653476 RepID=A0A0U5AWU9_9BACT|nr:hypothetical protein [Caldimicrobium thiodismutans]BAU22895.1 hypothetical protein THC_0501 [Caldimicrobium thiodismutans]